jgi:hypothetical protein
MHRRNREREGNLKLECGCGHCTGVNNLNLIEATMGRRQESSEEVW